MQPHLLPPPLLPLPAEDLKKDSGCALLLDRTQMLDAAPSVVGGATTIHYSRILWLLRCSRASGAFYRYGSSRHNSRSSSNNNSKRMALPRPHATTGQKSLPAVALLLRPHPSILQPSLSMLQQPFHMCNPAGVGSGLTIPPFWCRDRPAPHVLHHRQLPPSQLLMDKQHALCLSHLLPRLGRRCCQTAGTSQAARQGSHCQPHQTGVRTRAVSV
jgi:hypothetical protein